MFLPANYQLSSRLVQRLAVGFFFFLCGSTFATWASRIPTIKNEFHLNEAQLGSVLFLLPMGSIAVLAIAGWAIDRFGSNRMTLLTALCYAASLVVIAFCQTVAELSVALFFFGFFGNGLNISMNTNALQVEEKLYKKPLMASFHALWSAGAMTGAIVGGWAMERSAGLKAHFIGIAAIQVVFYIWMFFLLSKTEQLNAKRQAFSWPGKLIWLLGIICFCCTLCEGAMADWSSLYYIQAVTNGEGINTIGYSAFAFTMACGRLIGDNLIDRYGSKKILFADSLLISLGIIIALTFTLPITVIAGFALVGFGVSTIIPIVYTIAAKNGKMSPGSSLAAVSSIGFTGFLVGPPVIGFIAHGIGLRLALSILILLGITITILSRQLKIQGGIS